MRSGARSAAWAGVALVLAVATRPVHAADAVSVLVRSTSGAQPATQVTLQVRPDVRAEDRTAGARPTTDVRGPASLGDTFTDEVTLFLPGVQVARPAAVEVSDDLVSAVRLFPEANGTTVAVFVRQPASYTVSRTSAAGEIAIALRARSQPTPTRPAGARRAPIVGAGPAAAEGEVAVDAESLSYDQATDTLIARGSVSLTRGGTTLRADEVRYERGTGIAEARGNVVVVGPDGSIEGDVARIDVDDESGWVEDAAADLTASGFLVTGGKVEKGVGARYVIDDGVFTTCKCGGLEKPSWSISGRKTDVHLGGLGVARGVQFRVKDVPVLWLPVLPFPANNDRQTGFLMPRVGYSNRRGFQYEQPFYWAIDKSQDVTVATDVETAQRVGILGEYRYMWSRQTKGSFAGAYYNEDIRGRDEGTTPFTPGELNIPQNRFAFVGRHDSPFPGGAQYYLDLFAVSDDEFLREINNFTSTVEADVQVRTTRYTRSRTGILKTWNRGLAQLEAAYFQDLIDPEGTAPQRLPQARAEHRVPLLDGRVVARMVGEGVDFQRDIGFDGLRGDLYPELFVPFRLGRVLHGSLTGRVRETAYYLTDDDPFGLFLPHDCLKISDDPNEALVCSPADPRLAKLSPARLRAAERVSGGGPLFREPGPKVADIDRTHSREMAEVRGRLGTELARVYEFDHLGFTRLRHSVEPEIRWLFVPPLDDQRFLRRGRPIAYPNGVVTEDVYLQRAYLFDEVDAINRRNFFSWGLTTRLFGRGGQPLPAVTGRREDTDRSLFGDDGPDDGGEDDLDAGDPDADEAAEGALPMGPEPPPALFGPTLQPGTELLRIGLMHGYDVSRELQEDGSHLSDVDVGIRLTPSPLIGLSYDTTWSFERSTVVGQALGLVLREPWWTPKPGNPFQSPSTLAVTYTQIKDRQSGLSGLPLSAGFTAQGAEDVNGSLYVRLGDYLGFQFVARYDLDGGIFQRELDDGRTTFEEFGPSFLERDYILRIISRCNCWAVELGVSDKANPDERLFRLQVTLLGLGSFGQGTGSNFIGLTGLEHLGYRRPTSLGRTGW